MKQPVATCTHVKFRFRALAVSYEAVDGEVTQLGGISTSSTWRCTRAEGHRGKHRDGDGNEW